jgi:tetratricopeptide (TPR) repeat protein
METAAEGISPGMRMASDSIQAFFWTSRLGLRANQETTGATAAGGAAFGLRQTIQGFGLPWNRLRVRQDKAEAAATWNYEARARGVYTELENVLTITVRDPAVRVLRVEMSAGTRIEVEGGKAEGLEIVEVRAEALKALQLQPKHPGALHVLGVWNAEVMRLNGFSRAMAKTFLGGQVLGSASWPEAVRYLEASVVVEPNRLVHHLDLARIYRDAGRPNEARAAYQAALRAPLQDANDDQYRKSADEELKKLR